RGDCRSTNRNQLITRVIQEVVVIFLREGCGGIGKRMRRRLDFLHTCAQLNYGASLDWVWRLRQEDRGGNSCLTRSISNSSTVITRTCSNDTFNGSLLHILHQRIQRTTRLKRSRRQLGFEF